MFSQRPKSIIWYISVTIILFMFLIFGIAEASRKKALEDQDTIKEMITNHEKVTFNGNLFDVYINQDTKTITVRGRIKVTNKVDWSEVDEVKRYFKMINPDNFEFVYEFKFVYNS